MESAIIKVLVPTTLAFVIGVLITPLITHYLFQYKVWKKKPGKMAVTGEEAVEFNRLHKETEATTPRMGGIVIWGSVSITILGIWVLSTIFPSSFFVDFDFLTRSQTWIPFATLIIGSFVGFLNDVYDVTHHGNGLSLRTRLIIVTLVAFSVSWWFVTRLDVTTISVPFDGTFELGWYIIPFFILVSLALYASGIIDGIDGLSGGIFAIIFTAYAGVAFYQDQVSLAAFCGTVAGGTLAFLWFNIPPARFWMTETGTMGLTMTLAVVAFMTDTLGEGNGLSVLPIIGFPLVVTVLSNIIQIFSKKVFHKKVFRVAPLHHHFEAIGWPGYKVTMRYWILGFICAVMGVIIAIAF
jgi:phospho-N-acetylmuramoyl-pentapeptide-transferase